MQELCQNYKEFKIAVITGFLGYVNFERGGKDRPCCQDYRALSFESLKYCTDFLTVLK